VNSSLPAGDLAGPLLDWFDAHRRDLPWRRTSDPYAIWVSEIMLQQTQVATVIPYWDRWMARFPTVESLASSHDEDVLSAWQGLGYYRRCRLLLQGARWVVEHGMPRGAKDWQSVAGVGRYTAGAIASIAFEEQAALVDGNVERVFARLVDCDRSGTALNAAAWCWAESQVPRVRPGDWNQALMELGATVCTPVEPACGRCPLRASCVAFRTGRQQERPVREAKKATKSLRHRVWVPYAEGHLGLRQVPEGQWWAGMWEFPRVDVTNGASLPPHGLETEWAEELGTFKHTVTEHRITVEVSLVRPGDRSDLLRWLLPGELREMPISAPQRRVLAMALRHLGIDP
jgi:A/G-specific adenine glycosylase